MAPLPSSHFHDFIGYSDIANNDMAYDEVVYAENAARTGERLPQADPVIIDMFRSTQKEASSAAAFHGHPVVLMVANFMQKAHIWNWRNKSVQETIFPGLQPGLSPSNFGIGGIRDSVFKDSGSFGLLAKAFYNRCPDYSGRLNDGKFTAAINSLNSYFDQYATDLFAEYIRHFYHLRLSPSHDYVSQYKNLLLSPVYRSMKIALAASGGWPNPDLEIYIHLVKLLACGAATVTINSIYSSLTSGPYALSAGIFPSVTPSTWKSYRGWLSRDYLDWSDLNAQSLQDTMYTPIFGPHPGVSVVPLVALFANWFDYWKPSGGSCFSADTKVVMADGSMVEISRIQIGDEVRSRTIHGRGYTIAAAKVALVSKPKRARRPLYSYRGAAHIKFTATHPMVEPGRNGHPDVDLVLKFIDPDLARAINPSWHSVPVLRIPPHAVDCHDGTTSDPNETLYDLVFAPGAPNNCCSDKCAGITTYTVADPTGHEFEVASEAPVFEWIPYSMIFFQNLLQTLLRDDHNIASITASLLDPDIVVKVPWRDLAGKALKLTEDSSSAPAQSIDSRGPFSPGSVSELLANHEMGEDISQAVADAFESLHSMLGRFINHELSVGWAYKSLPAGSVPSDDNSDRVTLLFLQSLHLGGLTILPTQEGSHARKSLGIHISQNQERILTHNAEWRRRGWQTFECDHPIDISTLSFNTEPDGRNTWTIGLEVHDSLTNTTYRGQSSLREDDVTLISLGSAETSNQHALLDVRVMRVARGALSHCASWDGENKAAFAEALGACFAPILAEQVAQAARPSVTDRVIAAHAPQTNARTSQSGP